jgi:hypothetical protein
MSPAAAETVSDSPLLKLPAELRNRIYELVIESKPRIASLRTRKSCGLAMNHTMRFTAEYGMSEPALLATCRTIRREAMAEFRAHHSYKLVVSASSFDGDELLYWKTRLSSLFTQPDTQASNQLDEAGAPNLRTWRRVTRWLQRAQAKFSHGEAVNELNKRFDRGGVVMLCAVSKSVRDPKRKPWDGVKGGSQNINILVHEVQRSWRKDYWEAA